MSLFGMSRELQYRLCKLWQNHRQVHTTFYGKGGGIGSVLLDENLLEKRVQVDDGFQWLSCRGCQFLVGIANYFFPCWPVTADSFLFRILLLGSVTINSSCKGYVMPPLPASDSTLVWFPFISFHVKLFIWNTVSLCFCTTGAFWEISSTLLALMMTMFILLIPKSQTCVFHLSSKLK